MANRKALDVLGAAHAFISALVWPHPDLIVRGWQNRSALPASEDYAVLTLLAANRRGTNVHEYAYAGNGAFSVRINALYVFDIQADFCGIDESLVSARAIRLNMLARDNAACDFFHPYGLSSLYPGEPRVLPFVDNLNQWCVRYSVDLHLCGWHEGATSLDAFSSLNINLENVDVHHPPEGE